ncbi:MAG TPA: IclR family transcriptional regulator [Actinomycetota bacterium]|nr:IclR family transcriptional regulator [Actinomycetota bacterium]
MPAEYQIRSVTRALQVLIAVSELGEADLSTVARTVGLHPTTTLRMLESLRSRDLVRQRRGRYEIGARAFEIGCSFVNRKPLAHEAQALVDEMARRVNETASFGILDDGEVLYLAIAPGERELGIQSTAGGRHPAHCTALGKALLAHLPWEAVESILEAHPPVRLTASTFVDRAELRGELARVARQGYAIDAEERVPGVVCVAAPIRDQTGTVVAAISISGPGLRLTNRRIPALAEQVRKLADEASGILGTPEAAMESRV